ncbi:formate dehydrogenase accessory protein FdhE [Chloroflexota bacterium]
MKDLTSSQTLKKLEEWVKKEAHSSRFLDFYIGLLKIQADVEVNIIVVEPQLSEKAVLNRMANGKPLLRFSHLNTNLPQIQATFEKVVKVFSEYPDLFGNMPENLLKNQELDRNIAKAWFEGKSLPISAANGDIDQALLATLIQQAFRPFLVLYSLALIERSKHKGWQQGYCPICAGDPDIARLEKDVGERWLMCSRCDAPWRFPRLKCPFCGNQDSKTISYFSDEKEAYRLCVCDNCHTYVKAVDLRKVADAYLPLERLLTLDMDRQGQEKGYRPGYGQTEAGDKTQP